MAFFFGQTGGMLERPARPCKYPMCPAVVTDPTGYCETHRSHYTPKPESVRRPDTRPAPSVRGYGRAWQKIRARVLTEAGIPREDWRLYDIDHRPAYNPAVEPDHTKYTLVPMLRSDHSRKTARADGGYGRRRAPR